MADPIKGKGELYESNIFGDANKSGEAFEQTLIEINKALVALIGNQKEIAKATPLNSFKNIKKVNEAIATTSKLVKLAQVNDIKLLKVKQENEKVSQQKLKTLQQEIKAEADLEKAISQETKSRKEATNAIIQESKSKQENEKITQQQIKTEKAGEDLSQKVKKGLRDEAKERERLANLKKKEAALSAKLNIKIKEESGLLGQLKVKIIEIKAAQLFNKDPERVGKLNAALKRAQQELTKFKNIGVASTNTFGKALDSIGFKFNVLANVASSAAFEIANFVKRGIGSGITTIRDFDKELVNLAAISNKTRGEISGLEQEIRSVAAASINTGVEVAKTATALRTLGKSEAEIKKLLTPVNNLSIALQAPADAAGELLIKTLNAFGEGADEAQKFADVIAKVRTSSALNFQQIADAFGFITTTANAAGFSIEKTGAIVGILVDNNIKASRAGRLLSSSLIRLAKNGKTLEEGVAEITEVMKENLTETELLAAAGKIFGTESATIGIILAENTGKIQDQTKALEGAAGTLDELTNKQLASLDAALKILVSAWDELTLQLDDNLNFSERLGAAIRFLTRNLKTIVRVLTIVVATFIAYKTAILAVSLATKAYTLGTKLATFATVLFTKGVKAATVGVKAFDKVAKASVLGIITAAITAAALAWEFFSDSADEAAESQDNLNNKLTVGAKLLRDLVGALEVGLIGTREFSASLRQLSRGDLVELADTLEQKIGQATRQFAGQLQDVRDELEKEGLTISEINAELVKYQKALTQVSEKQLGDLRKALELVNAELRTEVKVTKEAVGLIKAQEKVVSALNKALKDAGTEKRIAELNQELVLEKEKLDILKKLGLEEEKETGLIALKTEEISKLNKALKEAESIDEIRRIQDLIKLRKEELALLINGRKQQEINGKLLRDLAAQSIALQKGTIEAFEELEEKRTENRKDDLKDIIDDEKKTNEERLKAQQQLNDILIQQELDLLSKEKEIAEQRKEVAVAVIDAISEAQRQAGERRLEDFDKEIQAQTDNIARLTKKANDTILDSDESLATEQKKQAELKLARQREEERQEKILAGFKILSALIEGGLSPAQAVPQTAALLAALPAIISALPSLDTGIENTDSLVNGGKGVDGKGGFHAVLHPGERVMTDEQNNMIPDNMSNWELANLAAGYNENSKSIDRAAVETLRFQTPTEMISLLQDIKDAAVAANQKETLVDLKLDVIRGITIETIKGGNKTTNIYKKVGGLW